MDIEKVAKMSRLWLSSEEKKTFDKDLDEILKMFEVLNSIDVSDEKIIIHPTPLSNVMRKDKPEKSMSMEHTFKNTKNKEEGYFKGPKTLE